jgi:hypothetical protein
MAAQQANRQDHLNSCFNRTLGIGDHELRAALHTQGLTSFNAFVSLKDDDIKHICSNIRNQEERLSIQMQLSPVNHQQSQILGLLWAMLLNEV